MKPLFAHVDLIQLSTEGSLRAMLETDETPDQWGNPKNTDHTLGIDLEILRPPPLKVGQISEKS